MEAYPYTVVLYRQHTKRMLQVLFPHPNGVINCDDHDLWNPSTGFFKLGDVDCWVVCSSEREDDGYTIRFKSRDEWKKIQYIIQDYNAPTPIRCLWSVGLSGRWEVDGSFNPKVVDNWVGPRDVLDYISREASTHLENSKILEELGEKKGMNFLLWGAVGTGKSHTVLTLATMNNLPLFTVCAGPVERGTSVSKLLTPKVANYPMSIIICEDFDRWLDIPGFDWKKVSMRFLYPARITTRSSR